MPPEIVIGGLVIPGTGLLNVSLQVPLGWPGDTCVFAQFLVLDTLRNEVQAANTLPIVTR